LVTTLHKVGLKHYRENIHFLMKVNTMNLIMQTLQIMLLWRIKTFIDLQRLLF